VGFFIGARGEYFSQQMEGVVAALAPAFPAVWFIRAEGPRFSRFTSQYMVRLDDVFAQLTCLRPRENASGSRRSTW
jgi:hypothetical protein